MVLAPLAIFLRGSIVVRGSAAQTVREHPCPPLALPPELRLRPPFRAWRTSSSRSSSYELFRPVSRTAVAAGRLDEPDRPRCWSSRLRSCSSRPSSCLAVTPSSTGFTAPQQISPLALLSIKLAGLTMNVGIVFFGFYCLLHRLPNRPLDFSAEPARRRHDARRVLAGLATCTCRPRQSLFTFTSITGFAGRRFADFVPAHQRAQPSALASAKTHSHRGVSEARLWHTSYLPVLYTHPHHLEKSLASCSFPALLGASIPSFAQTAVPATGSSPARPTGMDCSLQRVHQPDPRRSRSSTRLSRAPHRASRSTTRK